MRVTCGNNFGLTLHCFDIIWIYEWLTQRSGENIVEKDTCNWTVEFFLVLEKENKLKMERNSGERYQMLYV